MRNIKYLTVVILIIHSTCKSIEISQFSKIQWFNIDKIVTSGQSSYNEKSSVKSLLKRSKILASSNHFLTKLENLDTSKKIQNIKKYSKNPIILSLWNFNEFSIKIRNFSQLRKQKLFPKKLCQMLTVIILIHHVVGASIVPSVEILASTTATTLIITISIISMVLVHLLLVQHRVQLLCLHEESVLLLATSKLLLLSLHALLHVLGLVSHLHLISLTEFFHATLLVLPLLLLAVTVLLTVSQFCKIFEKKFVRTIINKSIRICPRKLKISNTRSWRTEITSNTFGLVWGTFYFLKKFV